MLEIELKFRCPDPDRVERRLNEMGITFQSRQLEIDHYFRPPDRDYAVTGEAFRLRRIGDHNAFTYKGPKRTDTTAKVRLEVELTVEPGDPGAAMAVALLEGLRYQSVATVKKWRKSFPTRHEGFDVTLTIDDCEGVGTFVEIEILAEESDRIRAESTLHALAGQLGLTDPEPRSYLRMTLETLAGKPANG